MPSLAVTLAVPYAIVVAFVYWFVGAWKQYRPADHAFAVLFATCWPVTVPVAILGIRFAVRGPQ